MEQPVEKPCYCDLLLLVTQVVWKEKKERAV